MYEYSYLFGAIANESGDRSSSYAFNVDPMFCYFYAEAEQARLNTLAGLARWYCTTASLQPHLYNLR